LQPPAILPECFASKRFFRRGQNVAWQKKRFSFRDGLAIAERLAKFDPGNAGWQRDLIVSYKKIADCSPPKRANLSRALEIAQAGAK
jgi:hypothetical protein